MPHVRPFRISNSLTDFSPLLFPLEYLFKRLKATGIDGVELVIGFKSRWSAKRIKYLSEKYDLPIISIHQPPWSILHDTLFDEGFVDLASKFGAKAITFHLLPNMPLTHPRMQSYLAKLSRLQERTGISMLIENSPPHYEPRILNFFFHSGEGTQDMQEIFQQLKKYNLQMTFDLDHLQEVAPHDTSWFKTILPNVGNIHLSSFTKTDTHLPLYMGDFQTEAFIQSLHKENYQGLLTFEFHYPNVITMIDYDFEAIKKSVELIKSL